MPRVRPLGILLLAALVASPASAQILRELDPIQLEYEIYLDDGAEPIGHASANFDPTDTPRGRRLEVESRIEYTVQRATPYVYSLEVSLTCDGAGVTRFVATETSGEHVKKHTGLRVGIDYQVSSDVDGQRTQKTITAGVQRTDVGLFCAGFLEHPLNSGEFFEDFPLLFPAMANHEGRQKFNEGIIMATVDGTNVPAIRTQIRHPSKTSDFYWHSADEHEMLLHLAAHTSFGTMRYELVSVNGERTDLGRMFR
jgi:hypothetical protein